MKDPAKIVQEIGALNKGSISRKRDYLSNLIVQSLPDKLNIRCSFIQAVKLPFESLEVTEDLEVLIDGILGFFVFLAKKNSYDTIESLKNNFVSIAKYDVIGYLKEGELFYPRTSPYSCYLNNL